MKRNFEAFDDESDLIEPHPEKKRETKMVEMPDSSDEVLELRQKVAKLEKDYQSSCRLVSEYESRMSEASFLENLFDNSLAVDECKRVDELQKKLAETLINLNKTTRKLNVSNRKNEQFQQQVNDLKRENEELHKANKDQAAQFLEDARKNTWEQLLLGEELKHRNRELRKAGETRERDQQRINELTVQLAVLEEQMKEMKEVQVNVEEMPELQQQPRIKSPKKETGRDPEFMLSIFSVCRWADADTILYNKAVRLLRAAYHPHNYKWFGEFNELIGDEILACELCSKPAPIFIGVKILEHFFSVEHAEKLRLQFGAVSMGAFEYWLDKLQQIPNPPPPSRLSLETPPVLPKMKYNLQMPKLKRQNMRKIILTKVKPQPNFGNKPYVVMLDADIPD